jgi:hypothetical protein
MDKQKSKQEEIIREFLNSFGKSLNALVACGLSKKRGKEKLLTELDDNFPLYVYLRYTVDNDNGVQSITPRTVVTSKERIKIMDRNYAKICKKFDFEKKQIYTEEIPLNHGFGLADLKKAKL